MGKPGPKFCLDNENKTKKKEKKKIFDFGEAQKKKYFPSFSKGARFSDFFFLILIQQCHSKHNTCTGLWGRGRGCCRASAVLWNSFITVMATEIIDLNIQQARASMPNTAEWDFFLLLLPVYCKLHTWPIFIHT